MNIIIINHLDSLYMIKTKRNMKTKKFNEVQPGDNIYWLIGGELCKYEVTDVSTTNGDLTLILKNYIDIHISEPDKNKNCFYD